MPQWNRREMLLAAGAGAATLALDPLAALAAPEEKSKGFTLPKLPYAYDALEPSIDELTMKIHHDKHHAAYVAGLNAALKDHPKLLSSNISQILRNIDKLPEGVNKTAVINMGGGHSNHTIFWNIMGPKGGGEPSGALAKAIDNKFGSFSKFQDALSKAGITQFGSGWGWLYLDKDKKLQVKGFPNQNSPYMYGFIPIMGVDVWEHAYYLKYKNERPKYVAAWWKTVNWKNVAERYAKAMKA
jgi:Fe-Mn family superoxide dismutase